MTKLNKEYMRHPHVVECLKKIEGRGGISASSSILRLFPGYPSVLLKFQKIRVERKTTGIEEPSTLFERFEREAGKILDVYELEFNSDKIPFRISNYEDILKEWLKKRNALLSQYSGEEMERELSSMTLLVGDEKELFGELTRYYPLRELYGRELHKIDFDRLGRFSRVWSESAFSEEMEFVQDYHLIVSDTNDRLEIKGIADLKRNRKAINRICRRHDIEADRITSIEQQTLLRGEHISVLPAQVNTVFSLREGEGCLLRERITLTIKRN